MTAARPHRAPMSVRRSPPWVMAPTRFARRCATSPARATCKASSRTLSLAWRGRGDGFVREEVLAGVPTTEDEAVEPGLRPKRLDDFIGQNEVKEHLSIVLS